MIDALFPRPIAHRGLHAPANGVIENSRTAFERAIARGFSIECDLQLTGDDQAVLFHDDVLERLTGKPGRVRDVSAAELTRTPLLGSSSRDCPQTLDVFLAQIDGRALLQIELKHQTDGEATETLARLCAEALAAYDGPVTVESFDPQLLMLVRGFGFTGKCGIITYSYEEPEWDKHLSPDEKAMLRELSHWEHTRFDFISCRARDLVLPAVRAHHKQGMPVTAWTVRSKTEALALGGLADQIVFEGFDPDSA